ncbi:MAG TPA: RNA methyltransferase [Thermoleophilaceae bacterium]|nr:RNA methyltransferase [Thermoleophilaceae bacterium]
MITSPDNAQLKQIRKLQRKKERTATGLFAAEGEDLVAAAAAAGWQPELLLRADVDVEPHLLERVSALGSGARVIGVYRQRSCEPRGEVCLFLHGVADPGNIGTIVRAAHAFCDGPVILGPRCADPWSPKAVRASMGSIFSRPPATAKPDELPGFKLALDGGAPLTLAEAAAGTRAPVVLCLGGERLGLPRELVKQADAAARIPLREGGPDSLNVAMAATVALYELRRGMAADA